MYKSYLLPIARMIFSGQECKNECGNERRHCSAYCEECSNKLKNNNE